MDLNPRNSDEGAQLPLATLTCPVGACHNGPYQASDCCAVTALTISEVTRSFTASGVGSVGWMGSAPLLASANDAVMPRVIGQVGSVVSGTALWALSRLPATGPRSFEGSPTASALQHFGGISRSEHRPPCCSSSARRMT
jgi:hypothetical protein